MRHLLLPPGPITCLQSDPILSSASCEVAGNDLGVSCQHSTCLCLAGVELDILGLFVWLTTLAGALLAVLGLPER
jgi:type IV secretory pathway TrbL component